MTQRETDFTIEDEDGALRAVKDLVGKETVKGYGSGPHFAWVDNGFAKAATLQEALKCWRWNLDKDYGIEFWGEKLGDDQILFDTIAPFVKAGSFIEMDGEDGMKWRWYFDGEKCVEQSGKVTWE
jgi:hypothetical protein